MPQSELKNIPLYMVEKELRERTLKKKARHD